jgi:hypothetical protein
LEEFHLNTGNRSGRSLGFSTGDGLATRHAVTCLDPSSAIDILRCCPNLRHLSLEVAYNIDDPHTHFSVDQIFGPSIVLSKLESFFVSFPAALPSNAFFETLVLPELRSFEFVGRIGKARPPFYSVLERASSLKEWTIQLQIFILEPVLECLKISPDLTRLKLQSLENMQLRSWYSGDSDWNHQELLNLLTASDIGVLRT